MKVWELVEICKKNELCMRCLYQEECDSFLSLRNKYLPCPSIPENVKDNHAIMEVEIPE